MLFEASILSSNPIITKVNLMEFYQHFLSKKLTATKRLQNIYNKNYLGIKGCNGKESMSM